MNNDTTKKFRKGDTAFWVKGSYNINTGVTSYYVEKITIQSWGKKEGTATHMDGSNTLVRFYINNPFIENVVLATVADVEAYAAGHAIIWQ